MGELLATLDAELARRFDPAGGVEARLTGDTHAFVLLMDEFVSGFMLSLCWAAGAIFVLIALLLRSLRFGLIAVLPNITPLALTLGYMGLRGYDLSASTVIVFAVSLGIAVDDTIHFLARYRQEARRDGDVPAAIRGACRGAGPPIVLTSVLIVAGLAVWLASDFVPTRRFIELLTVTMCGALVGDLLLLPACLRLFAGGPRAGTPK
jgi:hypothetical protein